MPFAVFPRLLIIGASARAAAWSAMRAGFQPVCADQFADRDLEQIADIVPVRNYPQSLPRDLKEISTDGWMFVGAMENHRAVLRGISQNGRYGRYCGPRETALDYLRDPIWLSQRLEPLDCYPAVQTTSPRATADGNHRWLLKPLAGAGGRAISFAADVRQTILEEPCYWQRFLPGTPFSALYLVSDAGCVLLMVSRQLIGLPEVAAPGPFHYCGSLGPWPVTAAAKDELLRIGETLVDGLEYRGLLGVDLIWHDGRFWVVEVNPRYTASGELLDFATGKSAVGLHLSACGFETPGLRSSAPVDVLAMSAICFGKLVLYADRRVVAPDLSCGLALRGDWSLPMIADIPQEGSSIPAGAPICTLFASADSAEACEVKLVRRARRIRQWFETAENSLGNGNNS